MNPDIDLRLQSMLKALTDVIVPALPAQERMAREQAGLLIGHLQIISEQWRHALNYELELCELGCALARELVELTTDHALTTDLQTLLLRAERMDRQDYAVVSAVHRELLTLIDRAIAADHVASVMPSALIAAVLHYNDRRAPRERVWHRGSGLDPDLASLPTVASLFTDGGLNA